MSRLVLASPDFECAGQWLSTAGLAHGEHKAPVVSDPRGPPDVVTNCSGELAYGEHSVLFVSGPRGLSAIVISWQSMFSLDAFRSAYRCCTVTFVTIVLS